MKKNIRLWHRDYKVLGICNLSPHSLTQIALEHFSTRKKANERMKKLFDIGLFNRFPALCLHEKGRAEYIYITSKNGVKVLLECDIEGLYAPNNSYKKNNRYKAHINHSLGINQFRIIVEKTYNSDKEISAKFTYGKQIIGNALDRCSLRPDAMFILEHKQTKRRLLHFLEIDMGTEFIKKRIATRSSYSFSDKLKKYINFFDEEYYKVDFNELSKVNFEGFRLMVVTTSSARTQSIINLAKQEEAAFVWATELHNLVTEHFSKNIWLTINNKRSNLTQIRR